MKKIPRLEFEEPLLDEISSQLIDECINKDYLKIFFSKLDREYAIEVLKKYLKSRIESDFYLFDQEYNLYLYAIEQERDKYDQLKNTYEEMKDEMYNVGFRLAVGKSLIKFTEILEDEGYSNEKIHELLSNFAFEIISSIQNDE